MPRSSALPPSAANKPLANTRPLCNNRAEQDCKVVDLPGKIFSLHCSPPWSRARVAVALEQGAVLYWDDYQERSTPFAAELAAPALQFIEDGWLVAASANECHLYRTAENYTIRWEANLPHWHGQPLAVLSTNRPDQFALVGADGVVAIYQVPRWRGNLVG